MNEIRQNPQVHNRFLCRICFNNTLCTSKTVRQLNLFFFLFFSKLKPKACAEAALSLLTCMEDTPCMQDKTGKKKTLYECMKDDKEAEPCKAERNAYYLCKHSQLNMRTRIRGTRAY